jgi:hypothetical protein
MVHARVLMARHLLTGFVRHAHAHGGRHVLASQQVVEQDIRQPTTCQQGARLKKLVEQTGMPDAHREPAVLGGRRRPNWGAAISPIRFRHAR